MPEEHFDERAMPEPADPWRTIGRPGTPDERTAYLGSAEERTAHFGDLDATVSIGSPDQTVHLSGPPLAPTVHAGGESEPTLRAHSEMRFGPGVPVTPVATPAWPAAAPAARPRPLLRRLVSLVSGLLTLALVVVVGLYLWQRLRPLEVEGATVAVPRPAGNRCDVAVDVVATVRTNGRGGTIRYQWFRSDAPPGPVLTERVGRGQDTATLTLTWTFSGVGTATETATVNIIEPSPVQATAPVVYRCRR
ncbi:hypothetical protein GCM10010112_67390 [Actinoplanes lobatus]|uniref:Uncharacterized protein n=1 Tax=Actinoplanes lobatus TaxID=113568 RepID=A0A7W7MHX6_9ACTN|nr:hypothetical protein [Actinoplanes lobatus]MBB4750932.1 hypothetical protein [Actinoplanes lobatus]GGN86170.1 hypothetical protein GCM10010112_67390 [Actinoplanes lobatus]GIE43506.1 hypothetical protein Alo02nite_64040 [Actinoplanes lobatus]